MRAELRKSGGRQCDACGAYDLVHADQSPLAVDFGSVLELEMLKREVRLAQVFKQHFEEAERDYASRLVGKDWEIHDEHNRLVSELEGILEAMLVDVPRWRLFKANREKKFRLRVDGAMANLYDRTQLPFTDAEAELVALEPDRS